MKRKKRAKENGCVGVSDLCELQSSAILSLMLRGNMGVEMEGSSKKKKSLNGGQKGSAKLFDTITMKRGSTSYYVQ